MAKRIMEIMIALALFFGMLNPSALANAEGQATFRSKTPTTEAPAVESGNDTASGQPLEGAEPVDEPPAESAPEANVMDAIAPESAGEDLPEGLEAQEEATEEGADPENDPDAPQDGPDISVTITDEAIDEAMEALETERWSVSVSVTSLSWQVQKNIRQIYSVTWNSKICAYERMAEDPIVTWTLTDSATKRITLKNDSSFTVNWSADLVSREGASNLFSVSAANSRGGGRSVSGTLKPGESCVVMVQLNGAAFERFAEDEPEIVMAAGNVSISFSEAR